MGHSEQFYNSGPKSARAVPRDEKLRIEVSPRGRQWVKKLNY